jgi:hypothetical protein
MSKAACKSKRIPLEFKTDTPCAERGHSIQPLLSAFAFLVSLREELRARKDIVERAKPLPILPIYVERSPRNGNLFFRSCPASKRIPLPRDPTTPEFHRAYHEALVDAGEDERDDWSELVVMHRAQRRGTAKRGAQR